jgi:hypothetical protein
VEIANIFQRISDPSLKAALPTSKADLKIIESRFGEIGIKVLKQEINFLPSGVCVHRNSFFVRFSGKISNALITGGIIQYWFYYLIYFEAHPQYIPPPEPKVFAIEDLDFGFFIWLIACGICVTAFLIEVLYCSIKVHIVKIFKQLLGLYFIVKFLSNKVKI